MAEVDGRRRRWVAVDVMANMSTTGQTLYDEFGGKGLLVWLSLIQLAKRSPREGVVTFVSDDDLFMQLGLPGLLLVDERGVEWDLESLWRRLGQLKQTRRRRLGRVLEITLTNWAVWQDMTRRGIKAEQKARSRDRNRGDNTEPIEGTYGDDTTPITPPDLDLDHDKTSTSTADDEIERQAREKLAAREQALGPVANETAWLAETMKRIRETPTGPAPPSPSPTWPWKKLTDDNRCSKCDGDRWVDHPSDGGVVLCEACHGTGAAQPVAS